MRVTAARDDGRLFAGIPASDPLDAAVRRGLEAATRSSDPELRSIAIAVLSGRKPAHALLDVPALLRASNGIFGGLGDGAGGAEASALASDRIRKEALERWSRMWRES